MAAVQDASAAETDAQRLQAVQDRIRLLEVQERIATLEKTASKTTTPAQLSSQAEASSGTDLEIADANRLIDFEAGQRQRAGLPAVQPTEIDPNEAKALGRTLAATGINMLGTGGGAAVGTLTSPVTGPIGPMAGGMIGGGIARKVNVGLGLEEPGIVGDALAVGLPAVQHVPTLALKGFQWILGKSRGAKQLKHTAAMQAAEHEATTALQAAEDIATAARLPLQATRAEGAQIATDAGLQSRELRAVSGGAFAAVKDQLGKKAEDLKTLAGRVQAGTRLQLAKTNGEEVEQVVRMAGRWGPEVSEEAVNLAYQQLDDVRKLPVSRAPIDQAVRAIPQVVRRGLREVLSIMPSATEPFTFAKLRGVQMQVGKQIRGLERAVARGEDINAPPRLEAMKKVYASTFTALEEAENPVVWASLPTGTREALEAANKLNRTMSLIDRVGSLREIRGTRIVAGKMVFDADGLLRAIKGDGFLVRILKQEGAYDNLTESLGRIASAQKANMPAPHLETAGIATMQQQMGREETLRTVGRDRASGALRRTTDAQLGTIDEQLKAAQKAIETQQTTRQEQIEHDLPAQEGRTGKSVIIPPIIAALVGGGLSRSYTGAMSTAGIAMAFSQIDNWLLTKNGQLMLEKLFAKDPQITAPKLALLLQAARGQAFTPGERRVE